MIYTARIKGKVMKKDEAEYNPVAVGDIAVGEPYSETEALIVSIEDRRSAFRRWNTKKEMNQTISANQDRTAIGDKDRGLLLKTCGNGEEECASR